jgi:hypothetical protein
MLRGKARDLQEVQQAKAAHCLEIASVAHNLCHVGGMPSLLVVGRLAVGEQEAGHAWQMVRSGNASGLYDAANPAVVRHPDKTVSLRPFTVQMDPLRVLMGSPAYTRHPDHEGRWRYVHAPSFPLTFEEFDTLSTLERHALSSIDRTRYQQLALQQVAEQYGRSGFNGAAGQ